MKNQIILCWITSTLIATPAWAETEQQYGPQNGDIGGIFGNSIDLNNDVIAVGAPYENDVGSHSGAVYIYVRNGNGWAEFQKVIPNDVKSGDTFGNRIGLDGPQSSYRMIAGSHLSDTKAVDAGAVYTYTFDGISWKMEQKLLASDGQAGDQFGFSTAISGNYAIVGAVADDDKGQDSGSAYIFERVNNSWVQKAKLLAPDGIKNDTFGMDVAIDGNRAVVSAIGPENLGPNNPVAGKVYIFERINNQWFFKKQLKAPIPQAADIFGYSVDIKGDYIVIGAPSYAPGTGMAYLAKYTKYYDDLPTDWYIIRPFFPSDSTSQDYFGHGVAISPTGDYVAVGSLTNQTQKVKEGAVYVFKKLNPSDRWVDYMKLTANNPVNNLTLGQDVDIESCEVIGSAPLYTGIGSFYSFSDIGIPCN